MFFLNRKKEQEQVPRTSRPAKLPVKPLTYKVANLQGIGKRERQEDAFASVNALDAKAIEDKGMLALVADGMGGMADGKIASETAISSIVEDFERMDFGGDIPLQLTSSLFKAGEKVAEKLNGDGGSTAVAAIVKDDCLYFASVGDSYIFILRNRQLIRLNRSQNVLNREYLKAISTGMVDPSGANEHEEKEALTQFMGMEGLEEIDALRKPYKLKAGDVILLCSDGVGGVLSEDCLTKCLSHGIPIDMCSAIESEILKTKNPYQDNYTALIIQCRG